MSGAHTVEIEITYAGMLGGEAKVPLRYSSEPVWQILRGRLTGQRLPWGNTQEVVPDTFMRPEPKSLRFWEQEIHTQGRIEG